VSTQRDGGPLEGYGDDPAKSPKLPSWTTSATSSNGSGAGSPTGNPASTPTTC